MDTLYIMVCSHFTEEVERVISAFKYVKLITYSPDCGKGVSFCEWIKPLLKDSDPLYRPDNKSIYVLGGACCAKKLPERLKGINIHHVEQCFYLIANKITVDSYLLKRYYLVSQGWLKNWESHLSVMGFDRQMAQEFFSESVKKLLLLDTGINNNSIEEIEKLSDYLSIPYEILPVGLEHLELVIIKIIQEWQEKKEKKILADVNRKLADYSVIMELTAELGLAMSEDDIVEKIFEFFTILFAPGELLYISMVDGNKTILKSRPYSIIEDEKRVLELLKLEGNYSSSDSGFRLKIKDQKPGRKDEIIGFIEIEAISFPEYKEHYLNLALNILNVCSLAILNARFYEKVLEAKKQEENARIEAENLNKKLEILAAEAEKASIAKGQFLASMSHEIRTPLNAITGLTAILLNTSLDMEQKDFIETIRVSGNILLSLINDILDFSKIEAGRMEIEEEPFNLYDCINEAVCLVKPEAIRKNIEVIISFSSNIPLSFLGDITRIRQILVNLLNNAVKFTSEGHIDLSVTGKKLYDNIYEVEFSVHDTGIGIEEDKKDLLFKPFSQIDASTTRKYGGTGLGLSISKHLCEIMGGTMWVESDTGKGSTFYFTVKIKDYNIEIEEKKSVTHIFEPEMAKNHPFKILLADDNPVNQKVLFNILKHMGYMSDIVSNGIEAIDALGSNTYDIIFMDVHMPHMDGMEATKYIRENWPKERQPAIIAMTAGALKEDRDLCFASGMNDYISKPIDINKLRDVIVRCRRIDEYIPSEEIVCKTQKEYEIFDRKELLDRMNGDEELVKELLELFLNNAPLQIEVLKQAFNERNLDLLIYQVHTIKGASGNMGAKLLVDTSVAIEIRARKGHMEEIPCLIEKLEEEFEKFKIFVKGEEYNRDA